MQRNTTVISPEQVQHQLELCRQVARLTAQWPQKPLAFVDTYGCQQNEADSERLRGYLKEMGFGFTDSEEQARALLKEAEEKAARNAQTVTAQTRESCEALRGKAEGRLAEAAQSIVRRVVNS